MRMAFALELRVDMEFRERSVRYLAINMSSSRSKLQVSQQSVLTSLFPR